MIGPSTKYRPDIDGLRALAVLFVVAFHLGLYRARGGFVGVDVFFVISGFLICSLLYADLQGGKFSLLRFYERRIRRILPALILVLAVTTIAAAFILLPPRFEDFAQSLTAAALSFSNFHFWHAAGYFDEPASTKPLLHTWSLAVEEQFYLAFPLLLAALYKLKRPLLIAALAAIAFVSFVASAVGVYVDETATFYLPLTRAWELLLGALLALGAVPTPRGRWADVTGVAGLALIFASFVLLTDKTPFPGAAALPACLGTAMVIAAGQGGEGISARVLSLKPIVLIGLISYSLYLWHWPIIVLLHEQELDDQLTHLQQAEVFAACLALSLLSWWFVERPFRRMQAPRGVIFAGAGAAIASIAVVGVVIAADNGVPQRFPRQVASLVSYAEYDPGADYRLGACFIDSHYAFRDFHAPQCLHADPGRPSILLMGDSHAAHLWRAIERAHPEANVMQATASGCLPTVTHQSATATCKRIVDYVYRTYLAAHHVDLLVLSADWSRDEAPQIAATLARLRARRINFVMLGRSPEYDTPLPILLAREVVDHDPGLAQRHRRSEVAEVDRAMAAIAVQNGARYVSTYDVLCPDGACRETIDGAPLQYDRDHFSPQGAAYVVRLLDRQGAFATSAPSAPQIAQREARHKA